MGYAGGAAACIRACAWLDWRRVPGLSLAGCFAAGGQAKKAGLGGQIAGREWRYGKSMQIADMNKAKENEGEGKERIDFRQEESKREREEGQTRLKRSHGEKSV